VDVKDLKARKIKAEDEIRNILSMFCAETGLRIDGISIKQWDTTDSSGVVTQMLIGEVRLDVKL
jgi:hypothetical protein